MILDLPVRPSAVGLSTSDLYFVGGGVTLPRCACSGRKSHLYVPAGQSYVFSNAKALKGPKDVALIIVRDVVKERSEAIFRPEGRRQIFCFPWESYVMSATGASEKRKIRRFYTFSRNE